MKKFLSLLLTASFVALCSCGPKPEEVAKEYLANYQAQNYNELAKGIIVDADTITAQEQNRFAEVLSKAIGLDSIQEITVLPLPETSDSLQKVVANFTTSKGDTLNDTLVMVKYGDIWKYDVKNSIASRDNSPIAAMQFALNNILAERGDSSALFNMSQYYQKNLFVERDKEKVLEYLTKAAERNHDTASYLMGIRWYVDYSQNWNKREQKLIHSALQGNKMALMLCAMAGDTKQSYDGVSIDQLAETIKKEANAGNPDYFAAMGSLYFEGNGGFKQNFDEAAKWYLRGAEQGDAASKLGLAYVYSTEVYSKHDFQKSMDIMNELDKEGEIFATLQLLRSYYNGMDRYPRDRAKAMEYINKADSILGYR